jgi:hypothetical protein
MLTLGRYYGRMASNFAVLLKHSPVPDPEQVLREGLAKRNENFLKLIQRGIFENPRTPYHRMFQLAQCSFQDLESMVRGGRGWKRRCELCMKLACTCPTRRLKALRSSGTEWRSQTMSRRRRILMRVRD